MQWEATYVFGEAELHLFGASTTSALHIGLLCLAG